MDGSQFINRLKNEFNFTTDTEVAKFIGRSTANINKIKNDDDVIALVISRIIRDINNKCEKYIEKEVSKNINKILESSIEDVIEYAPIQPSSPNAIKTVSMRYHSDYVPVDLRKLLEGKHGVYVFYSSMCRPIYVGKAKKLDLWTESNNSFMKLLKKAVRKVQHQKKGREQKIKKEITRGDIFVYDVASYYSAYEVDKSIIDKVESLMIRSFINELSNIKVEGMIKIEKESGV